MIHMAMWEGGNSSLLMARTHFSREVHSYDLTYLKSQEMCSWEHLPVERIHQPLFRNLAKGQIKRSWHYPQRTKLTIASCSSCSSLHLVLLSVVLTRHQLADSSISVSSRTRATLLTSLKPHLPVSSTHNCKTSHQQPSTYTIRWWLQCFFSRAEWFSCTRSACQSARRFWNTVTTTAAIILRKDHTL